MVIPMKCKSCKREIPENSIFCNWCGEKQIKVKRSKTEIKVPAPKQLPSGSWRIQLKAEGQSVTEKTPELCIAKARAIRAGFIEEKKKAPKLTVNSAIGAYIQDNSNVLSPSTLRGYRIILKNRFVNYHDTDISSVDWQRAINEEATVCSPKTLKNSWGLVATVMRHNGIAVPNVRLPQVVEKEQPWLNFEQIQILLKEVYGKSCEMAVLLALHSLRRSELLCITPSKVDERGIHVDGAVVYTENALVEKDTNKNAGSKRVVPIMIPRLQELFDTSDNAPDEPYVTEYFQTGYKHINKACRDAGLPEVGYHGLRRSFASLAYHAGWPERVTMQIGGWADWQTMHKVYIKLDNSDVEAATQRMKKLYENLTEYPTT